MTNKSVYVKEATNFLGWGMLTGSARNAFEKCDTLEEALVLVPACTRKYAEGLIEQVGLEKTPEFLFFVSLGILGDSDFSCCARKFPNDTRNKLVDLEALLHEC